MSSVFCRVTHRYYKVNKNYYKVCDSLYKSRLYIKCKVCVYKVRNPRPYRVNPSIYKVRFSQGLGDPVAAAPAVACQTFRLSDKQTICGLQWLPAFGLQLSHQQHQQQPRLLRSRNENAAAATGNYCPCFVVPYFLHYILKDYYILIMKYYNCTLQCNNCLLQSICRYSLLNKRWLQ